MSGVVGDRVLQCSDGHLFISSEGARLFASIHLGPKRLMKCPVDGRWRMAANVRASDLSQQQLENARRYHT
jgi:hypothetical protein